MIFIYIILKNILYVRKSEILIFLNYIFKINLISRLKNKNRDYVYQLFFLNQFGVKRSFCYKAD